MILLCTVLFARCLPGPVAIGAARRSSGVPDQRGHLCVLQIMVRREEAAGGGDLVRRRDCQIQ